MLIIVYLYLFIVMDIQINKIVCLIFLIFVILIKGLFNKIMDIKGQKNNKQKYK